MKPKTSVYTGEVSKIDLVTSDRATIDAGKTLLNTVQCTRLSFKRVSRTALNFSGFENCFLVDAV